MIKQETFLMSYVEVFNFNFNENNRDINSGNVKKLKDEYKKHGKFEYPIIVNECTGHVLDGQHRLAAFRTLVSSSDVADTSRIEVKFVNIPAGNEVEYIRNINQQSKHWTGNDFIASEIAMNNPHYISLKNFCASNDLLYGTNGKKTEYKYNFGAAFITGGRTSGLNNGKFQFTKEEYAEAAPRYKEIKSILEIIFGSANNVLRLDNIVSAWENFRYDKKISLPEWYSYFKKYKKTIRSMAHYSRKDWESIFNYVYGLWAKDSNNGVQIKVTKKFARAGKK